MRARLASQPDGSVCAHVFPDQDSSLVSVFAAADALGAPPRRHAGARRGRGGGRAEAVPAVASRPALPRRAAWATCTPCPVSPAYRPDPQFQTLGPEFGRGRRAGGLPADDLALPQRPRRRPHRAGHAHRGRVARRLRPVQAVAGQPAPPAGHPLPRPPVPGLQCRDRRRPGLPLRPDARGRRSPRPAPRSRHQGLGPDPLLPLRRRAADPEGRGARGAGHRDAGGAGRTDLQERRPVSRRAKTWSGATNPPRRGLRC